MTNHSGIIPGHPRGLSYLFFAELWERFSFYGMRALLTLYMTKQLFADLSDRESFSIGLYASYGALVYTTPLIGGFIADKLIGYSKAVTLGAVLMMIGHFVLAFDNLVCFYTALALLIVGNGFFKPNISSIVGSLYEQGDARRDAGFVIFYMAINTGAMIAPLVCGWLAEKYGWHYGFGLAGLGMLAGLLVFKQGEHEGVFGVKNLPVYQPQKEYAVYAGALVLVPIMAFLLLYHQSLTYLLNIALAVALVVFIVLASRLAVKEVLRLLVVLILTFFVTVFWAFFEQAGSSLTLYADKNVALSGLNASQTNSINPFFIVVLTFPFSALWIWLDKMNRNPSIPFKFALGILQLGIGFGIFALSALYVGADGRVPMLFLILGYFFITTGELCVSPVGLSMVTKLSPPQMTAFMMGIWFLASAFAHHLAGVIGKLTTQTSQVSQSGSWFDRLTESITAFCTQNFPHAENVPENFVALDSYTTVFVQISLTAFAVSILVGLLSPTLKKMMSGVK